MFSIKVEGREGRKNVDAKSIESQWQLESYQNDIVKLQNTQLNHNFLSIFFFLFVRSSNNNNQKKKESKIDGQ